MGTGGDAERSEGRDKSAVTVCARFRPLNEQEAKQAGTSQMVRFNSDKRTVRVEAPNEGDTSAHEFTFDRVFSPDATQAEVFEYAARPLVEDVLAGYYATGVVGDEDKKGVIPRAVELLFQRIAERSKESDNNNSSSTNNNMGTDVSVSVSYVEIYMERVSDLLDKSRTKTNLEIRVDLSHGVYVDGATEAAASTDKEVLDLLAAGSKARHVGYTDMNAQSSRSHAILMITVSQRDLGDLTARTGRLFLVDLAGSESIGKTGALGGRLEEAKHINKSLSALGNVIKALTEHSNKAGVPAYVPYRDSKLTRLLQDSLGGGSRAALVITCSPSAWNFSESLSTLRFGHRAKRIKNKPRQHVGYGGGSELDAYRDEVREKLREHDVYRAMYGDLQLPPLNPTGSGSTDNSETSTSSTHTSIGSTTAVLRANNNGNTSFAQQQAASFKLPPGVVNVRDLLDAATRRCEALAAVIQAMQREALATKNISADIITYLSEERHLFGRARTLAASLSHTQPNAQPQPLQPPSSALVELQELLAMGRWRVEDATRSLKPLAWAAAAVARAANACARLVA
eukprot:jgi/Chlat1/3752/Chrsp259S00286